jgi:hypothetical protein
MKSLRFTLALISAGLASPALAGPNCSSFFANADGSWSPTHPFMFATPTSETQLMPSDRILPQMTGAQGVLARYLNARCRFERPTVGPGRIPLIP